MKITLKSTERYQEIAYLDSQLFPEDEPIENWQNSEWWIGYHKGEIISYCSLKCMGDYVYLNRAGVLDEFQGNGIQKKMIKKRLDWCKANNIKYAITYTSHLNSASINSLIGMGFKAYRPNNMWAGSEFLYWKWKA